MSVASASAAHDFERSGRVREWGARETSWSVEWQYFAAPRRLGKRDLQITLRL